MIVVFNECMIAYLESAKRKCNLAVQATEAPPEASSGVEGFIVDAKLCDKYSLSVKTMYSLVFSVFALFFQRATRLPTAS